MAKFKADERILPSTECTTATKVSFDQMDAMETGKRSLVRLCFEVEGRARSWWVEFNGHSSNGVYRGRFFDCFPDHSDFEDEEDRLFTFRREHICEIRERRR